MEISIDAFEIVRERLLRDFILKNDLTWDVTQCGSCKNQRFGGTYRLLLQGDRIGELGTTLALTSYRRTLRTPKRRFLQEPHGLTYQKTAFLIVTAVETSNFRDFILISRLESRQGQGVSALRT
jgi:hypothetical protein